MATQTRPFFKTGAALATAAAIAVASPAIAPNLTPTPNALSAAQVELASFATLASLTYDDYVTAFFQGYGYTLTPNQPENIDWAAAYVGTGCDFSCAVVGLSGMAYMALDALITGNTPQTPQADVTVRAVNYYFEGGFSSGLQYQVSEPFGNPNSPLYNPQIASAIALAFQGAYAFTTIYIQALKTIGLLAYSGVPVLGPYIYGGIQAYLGPNTDDEFYGAYGLYAGLSGLLDWALLGFPVVPPTSAASTRSAAAVANTVVAATSASTDTVSATSASAEAEIKTPEAAATTGETVTPTDSTPTDSTPAVSTPASGETPESTSTEAVSDSTPADTTPADTKPADTTPADTTPAVDSPSTAVADSTADATPAATKPADAPAKAGKRPVRNAADRAVKKVASAISGAAKAAAASVSGS